MTYPSVPGTMPALSASKHAPKLTDPTATHCLQPNAQNRRSARAG
ncbi:hypothetical protein [Mycobacterium phage Fezzik]|nr:hypothetical protein [Mycobacterium phage Fezzik]